MKSLVYILAFLFCFSEATSPPLGELAPYNYSIIFLITISETYDVKKDKISVSGFSSGGFFATQLHVAHSGTIMGAGIIAGGMVSFLSIYVTLYVY